MKTTIDGAGRVVVPKRLREQCGLAPGAELEIEAVGDGVVIRPAHARETLVERDGVLVHRGGDLSGVDVVALIRGQREDRSRRSADRR